jgi:4-amino-4-deoxy-L-arabinose transferase-like glycosyltransferase
MNSKNGLLFLLLWLTVLAIGIYLISTTYLITKDGPAYIAQAQLFETNPLQAIKGNYFGYPCLVFLFHKTASAFGLSNDIHGWIISAQFTTLLCMLAALVPLYFIGKSFLGREISFYALAILAFLPPSARLAVDVLRDWPCILFLSLGFIILIAAAKNGKSWLYAIVGIISGLGFFIRAECAQIIIYALLWLIICAIYPRYQMTRKNAVFSILFLLVFFTAVVLPYMHLKRQFVPEKIEEFIDKTSLHQSTPVVFTAGAAANLPKSIIKVFQRTAENLCYYFFAFSLIGFYLRFIKNFKKVSDIEKIFTISFISFNILMLLWLFCNFNYLSRRHCMPLSLFFLFYSPLGLQIIGEKISSSFKFKPIFWFCMLLVTGILICLPRLLETKRNDLAGFLQAADWLSQNTSPQDVIAAPDERIYFYAQRKGIQAWEKKDLKEARFAIAQVKAEDTAPDWGDKQVWFWVNPEKKDSKLVIYKRP